jgi:hypothetical protein
MNMLTRQIPFQEGAPARAIHIAENAQIESALDQLEILHPQNVIILVGQAGGIRWLGKFPVRRAVGIVAHLADKITMTGNVLPVEISQKPGAILETLTSRLV